jgi:hydroxypyruvate reductase
MMRRPIRDGRSLLLGIWQQAIAAVDGRRRVREALSAVGQGGAPWQVIAVGKAAAAMTLGAFDVLGSGVAHALVISKSGHFPAELDSDSRIEQLPSGHPLPDARSLVAGARLLAVLDSLPRARRVLFLISGGSSSLVEVLPAGITLGDLARVNQWALASGYDIARINLIRRRLSLIKGGRLLARMSNREALALFISDVPGDDPDRIGSGLVGRATDEPLPGNLPAWLSDLLAAAPAPVLAAPDAVTRRVIATLDDALAAAEQAGRSAGLHARRDTRRFDGDAVELATRFCRELKLGPAGLAIWGGESTLRLPANPGRGGRNQHLALAAARLLVSRDDLTLLAAGTDGTDGPTTDAGAIVDGETLERGTLSGLDADDCLARADSGAFLEASGDLVHSGPTGTNVGDLVLGLKRV